MKQIRAEIEDTKSDYDREKLQERLAKIIGGVAVIKVGAATEVEMKEKKARVEDALNATRAAVEEGIIREAVSPSSVRSKPWRMQHFQRTEAWFDIVCRALEEPLRQIAANAGCEGSIVVEKVREGKGSYGFDADSEQYVDMFEAGIIDPTKVPVSPLQNAASLLLLC